MTAVSLIGAMLGARADGDSGGRAPGDAGASFGAALLSAGRMLGATEGDDPESADPSGTAHDGATTARPTHPAGTAEVEATPPAVLPLPAQLLPVVREPRPDGGEPDAAQPGSGESARAAALVDAGSSAASAAATQVAAPSAADSPATTRNVAEAAAGAPAGVATSAASVPSPVPAPLSAAAPLSAPAVQSAAAVQAAAPTPAAEPAPDAPADGSPRTTAQAGAEQAAAHAGSGASVAPAGEAIVNRRVVGESADRVQQTPTAPATTSAAPTQPAAPSVAAVAAPDAPGPAARAIATQVSPVVVNVAQRPAGTHHLTMTIAPDSLGPVTVRAHITAGGDVRVELSGATDAGRDALRGILTDLRRDLASVMPHATLSVGHGTAADANPDRGLPQGSGGAAGDHGSGSRDTDRGRAEQRSDSESTPARPRISQTPPLAAVGAGLDTFA